jgi:hypothetical protein
MLELYSLLFYEVQVSRPLNNVYLLLFLPCSLLCVHLPIVFLQLLNNAVNNSATNYWVMRNNEFKKKCKEGVMA